MEETKDNDKQLNLLQMFSIRTFCMLPKQNGPFVLFGLPICIQSPNGKVFLSCEMENDTELKLPNIIRSKEFQRNGKKLVVFQLEPKENVICAEFHLNGQIVCWKIVVVTLKELNLNSVLSYVDRIHHKIIEKPNNEAMFDGIDYLYSQLKQETLKDRKYWKNIINNSNNFSSFWKHVKDSLLV